jgi:aspartyl-tRNA synthetase
LTKPGLYFLKIDLEMPFASDRDVMEVTEKLTVSMFAECGHDISPTPFPELPYLDSMKRYGSDKPDVRFGEIYNLTSLISSEFASSGGSEPPRVEAIKLSPLRNPENPRETDLEELSDQFFASVQASDILPRDGNHILSSIQYSEATGLATDDARIRDRSSDIASEMDLKDGDQILLYANSPEKYEGGWTTMGRLRSVFYETAVQQGLAEPLPGFHFLWVTDFPLFTPVDGSDSLARGEAGLAATHHPFTAPKSAHDFRLLESDPLAVKAAHYDLVVNGVELGGGSRRIHNADVQEYVFRHIFKMSDERIEDFRHLLEALRVGCPPHAGIALGFDRLMAMALGRRSVRDVIAFPKNNRGEDVMVKSPNSVTAEQWSRYHVQAVDSR